jgi:hypothetical protein
MRPYDPTFQPAIHCSIPPFEAFLMQILIIMYPAIRCGPERGQCGMGRAFF